MEGVIGFTKLVTVIFGTKCNISLIKENICLFYFQCKRSAVIGLYKPISHLQ